MNAPVLAASILEASGVDVRAAEALLGEALLGADDGEIFLERSEPLVRAALQTELKEIFARLSRTVILVTHDLAEAVYLADHIVLLRDGAVVQQGTWADLRDRPAEPFVTEFVSAQRRVY